MARVTIESVNHPGRTKKVSRQEARALVALGRFRYQTTALEGGPPRREPPRDELADVVFASEAAREAARAAGLRASAFAGKTGSGKDGAFTKAEVIEIVKDWA